MTARPAFSQPARDLLFVLLLQIAVWGVGEAAGDDVGRAVAACIVTVLAVVLGVRIRRAFVASRDEMRVVGPLDLNMVPGGRVERRGLTYRVEHVTHRQSLRDPAQEEGQTIAVIRRVR